MVRRKGDTGNLAAVYHDIDRLGLIACVYPGYGFGLRSHFFGVDDCITVVSELHGVPRVADGLDGNAHDAGDFPVGHFLDPGKVKDLSAFFREVADGPVQETYRFRVVIRFFIEVRNVQFGFRYPLFPEIPAGFLAQQGDGLVQGETVEPCPRVFDLGQMLPVFPDGDKDFADRFLRKFFPFQYAPGIPVAGRCI